jgi:hypothetical protein
MANTLNVQLLNMLNDNYSRYNTLQLHPFRHYSLQSPNLTKKILKTRYALQSKFLDIKGNTQGLTVTFKKP